MQKKKILKKLEVFKIRQVKFVLLLKINYAHLQPDLKYLILIDVCICINVFLTYLYYNIFICFQSYFNVICHF
jgi:hypothetical protein